MDYEELSREEQMELEEQGFFEDQIAFMSEILLKLATGQKLNKNEVQNLENIVRYLNGDGLSSEKYHQLRQNIRR